MFRILQTDPESASLQINATALLKHKHAAVLLDLVDKFFTKGASETLLDLLEMPQTKEKVSAVAIYSNLLHEMRHYVDFILTPFGFHRLRVAFECYLSVVPVLSNEKVTQIPIPLMTGSSSQGQEWLGLVGYEKSPAKSWSQLLLSRTEAIVTDNRHHGGDAILEALAFTVQADLALALFPQPEFQSKMPYLYRDLEPTASTTSNRFDLTYRWHYAMAHLLSSNPGSHTMKLIQWILYASICGSFAATAKYRPFRPFIAAKFSSRKRYVDELLPSHRLRRLFEYFRDAKVEGYEDHDDACVAVNDACAQLFGKTFISEIEEDVNADLKLLQTYEENARNKPSSAYSGTALGAFKDLVNRRQAFFAKFKTDPKAFVHAAPFLNTVSEVPKPCVIFNYLHGASVSEISLKKWHEVSAASVPDWVQDENKEPVIVSLVYSALCEYAPLSRMSLESWLAVLGVLVPTYKRLLYGNKYRSMLEFDISRALLLGEFENKIIWDDEYRIVGDISDPSEYFAFYDLSVHTCDVCGRQATVSDCKYVSGMTLRQNAQFVEDYKRKYPNAAAVLLSRDWSGWLICSPCLEDFDSEGELL